MGDEGALLRNNNKQTNKNPKQWRHSLFATAKCSSFSNLSPINVPGLSQLKADPSAVLCLTVGLNDFHPFYWVSCSCVQLLHSPYSACGQRSFKISPNLCYAVFTGDDYEYYYYCSRGHHHHYHFQSLLSSLSLLLPLLLLSPSLSSSLSFLCLPSSS